MGELAIMRPHSKVSPPKTTWPKKCPKGVQNRSRPLKKKTAAHQPKSGFEPLEGFSDIYSLLFKFDTHPAPTSTSTSQARSPNHLKTEQMETQLVLDNTTKRLGLRFKHRFEHSSDVVMKVHGVIDTVSAAAKLEGSLYKVGGVRLLCACLSIARSSDDKNLPHLLLFLLISTCASESLLPFPPATPLSPTIVCA
jgi:hypothetical protein